MDKSLACEKICVIGMGYIGLPTALMFAMKGYEVRGVDKDQTVLERLRRGETKHQEEGIWQLLKQCVSEGTLKMDSECSEADAFIITVPTPIDELKRANMQLVIEAVQRIVPYLKTGNSVVIESTCSVGTTQQMIQPEIEKWGLKVGQDIYLGYCPERVMPGNILEEIQKNNRIIGADDPESIKYISEWYKSFVTGEIILTDTKTAELCKITENTFRDVNIALANELAQICDQMQLDVGEVIHICNQHPRVNLLAPGPGVGGHCLAVDPYFIIEKMGEKAKLMACARAVNESMPSYVSEQIMCILGEQIGVKKVTLLGITYKANCADQRESPMQEIIHLLEKASYQVVWVDPYVQEVASVEESVVAACEGSGVLVLGVGHEAFKRLPFERIYEIMATPYIFDCTGEWGSVELEKKGFKYKRLGNGKK